MVKQLPLPHDMVALVDDEDYEWASQFRWHLAGSRPTCRYVTRTTHEGKHPTRRSLTVYLHKEVLPVPAGIQVDHKNGDRLDNRRENLRTATRSQQEQNKRGVSPRSQTGVRGVTWHKHKQRYVAQVWIGRKRIYLGAFSKLIDAEAAAKEGRRRYYTHAPECEA